MKKDERRTLTDYIVTIDDAVQDTFETRRQALNYVRNLGQSIQLITGQPNIVQVVKRTTTYTVTKTFVPKVVNTLVSDELDSGFAGEPQ